ncbi:MAG: hypothetical protein GY754_21525 [bacterium]|nr:hypothetical protein [bacterium]
MKNNKLIPFFLIIFTSFFMTVHSKAQCPPNEKAILGAIGEALKRNKAREENGYKLQSIVDITDKKYNEEELYSFYHNHLQEDQNLLLVNNKVFSDKKYFHTLASSKSILCVKSTSYDNAKKYLEQRVDKIKYISLIPKDKPGIKNVFTGITFKKNNLKYVEKDLIASNEKIKKLKNTIFINNTSGLSASKKIEMEIKNNKNEFLIIIGHNKGMVF